MPKQKQTAEEKLEYYGKKLRKYEAKNLDGVSQRSEQSSLTGYTPYWKSSEGEKSLVDPTLDQNDTSSADHEDSEQIPTVDPTTAVISSLYSTKFYLLQLKLTTQLETASVSAPDTELNPELVIALGEVTDGTLEFSDKIHNDLSQLWLPLLKMGLPKENKEMLLKEYLRPKNCKLLQAPKLNAEITAAVSELSRNRDKKIASTQQQLGVGITAINRAMTILLNSLDMVKAIKHLSDGCRILCDLHYYLQSHHRNKLITSGLDKSFCQVIQDVERDETLFGKKLSEQIKASKGKERQGLQIKKPLNNPKPSTSQSIATRFAATKGNWAGYTRSLNRGERGGGRKPSVQPPSIQRAAPAMQQNQQNSNKPRGPPAQRR